MASLGGSPADQLAAYRRQLLAQLEKLSSTVVDEAVLQLKLKALVLDLIHHISVLDQLIQAENNQSIGCWTWQRQLRFYLVKMLLNVFLQISTFFDRFRDLLLFVKRNTNSLTHMSTREMPKSLCTLHSLTNAI